MADARFPGEFVDLFTCVILPNVLERISAGMIVAERAFPIRVEENTLILAVEEPDDFDLRDRLRFITNQDVRFAQASAAGIDFAISKYLGT